MQWKHRKGTTKLDGQPTLKKHNNIRGSIAEDTHENQCTKKQQKYKNEGMRTLNDYTIPITNYSSACVKTDLTSKLFKRQKTTPNIAYRPFS